MAYQNSPKIVTSGLALCYDVNNAKSYIGEPTTNLVNPSWAAWTTDGSGQGNIGTRTINSTYNCTITDSNSNTRQNIYIDSGITASTNYTFSVRYQKLTGTPTLRFQIQAYNSSTYISTIKFATTAELGITDVFGWQTASITLTTPASCNRILWFMQDGDDYTTYTHSFMLENVQCEQKNHVTPFTPSSRSNTGSLLDLTRNYTLNLSAAGFDNNANLAFSALSATVVDLNTQSLISGTNPFTIEAWYNLTGNGSYTGRAILTNYGSGYTTNNLWFAEAGLYIGGNVYFDSYQSTMQGLNCIAATRDAAGNVKLYKNGNLVKTGTLTGSVPTNINWRIGADVNGGGEAFNGYIYNVKVYNNVLTASEILQNFNATKSRFSL